MSLRNSFNVDVTSMLRPLQKKAMASCRSFRVSRFLVGLRNQERSSLLPTGDLHLFITPEEETETWVQSGARNYRSFLPMLQFCTSRARCVSGEYRIHPRTSRTQEKYIPLDFLVLDHIDTIAISYPCIRCTPSFGSQFGDKKVRLIHGWIRYSTQMWHLPKRLRPSLAAWDDTALKVEG